MEESEESIEESMEWSISSKLYCLDGRLLLTLKMRRIGSLARLEVCRCVHEKMCQGCCRWNQGIPRSFYRPGFPESISAGVQESRMLGLQFDDFSSSVRCQERQVPGTCGVGPRQIEALTDEGLGALGTWDVDGRMATI